MLERCHFLEIAVNTGGYLIIPKALCKLTGKSVGIENGEPIPGFECPFMSDGTTDKNCGVIAVEAMNKLIKPPPLTKTLP